MAIIEPQKEPRNLVVPLVAGIILLLVLSGLGYLIYTMISGPSHKLVKLNANDAKKAAASGNGNNGPAPQGPPLPAMAALQQIPDPGATNITLDLKNTTLSQAVDALSKQSGISIRAQNNGGGMLDGILAKRFDLSISNQPFWTAVQELCKAGHVYPAPFYYGPNTEAQITLVGGASPNAGCPMVTVGSSKLLLTGITSRFNADMLGVRAINRQMSVAMLLYVDPKLKSYRISPVITIETAVDENGVSLLRPKDPWADRNNGGQRSKFICSLQGQLAFPNNAGQRIATLKGYATIVTAGPSQTVKIKDPLTSVNVDNNVDGQPIRLIRLTSQGGQSYEAAFLADVNSPLFKDWDSLTTFTKLFDASGKEFSHNGSYMGGGNNKTTEFGIEYSAQGGMSAPAELDITLPTQLREVRVPFEFTDLPLPH